MNGPPAIGIPHGTAARRSYGRADIA